MKITAQARRSRYAPVVLLLLALFCTAGLYSLISPGTATATSGSSEANVQEGEALFEANCASCHGPDAAGTDIAPSLTGVGAASVHFQMITGRMPMANNSPQAEVKAAHFSEAQIEDVAAYVATLGPGPAIPTADMVNPEKGNPATGMDLFRTNCSMCHNAVGAGGALSEGKVAPSLMDSTPVEIYEAMVTGPQSMPVFNDANITAQGKLDVIAYIDYQQNAESIGGNNLGSVGPVVEGMWIWIVGIGGLCVIAVWIGAKKS